MEAIGDEFANFSPKNYFPFIDFSHCTDVHRLHFRFKIRCRVSRPVSLQFHEFVTSPWATASRYSELSCALLCRSLVSVIIHPVCYTSPCCGYIFTDTRGIINTFLTPVVDPAIGCADFDGVGCRALIIRRTRTRVLSTVS